MKIKDIVIFDLDGTLALIDHRRHLVEGKTKDWPAFYAACVDDLPNEAVIAALRGYAAIGCQIVIFSGRSDEVRNETKAWLIEHLIASISERVPNPRLIMRKEGDFTADDVLKRQWLNDPNIIDRERVLCVFDDRDKVVKMWRDEGIPCFQVAPGDF